MKKEYSANEAAVAVLNKVKKMAEERLAKKEELAKAAPTTAQAAKLDVQQPAPPQGNEKIIDSTSKEALKLKKFLDVKASKRMKKGAN